MAFELIVEMNTFAAYEIHFVYHESVNRTHGTFHDLETILLRMVYL